VESSMARTEIFDEGFVEIDREKDSVDRICEVENGHLEEH